VTIFSLSIIVLATTEENCVSNYTAKEKPNFSLLYRVTCFFPVVMLNAEEKNQFLLHDIEEVHATAALPLGKARCSLWWTLGPVWTGAENLTSTAFPDPQTVASRYIDYAVSTHEYSGLVGCYRYINW